MVQKHFIQSVTHDFHLKVEVLIMQDDSFYRVILLKNIALFLFIT